MIVVTVGGRKVVRLGGSGGGCWDMGTGFEIIEGIGRDGRHPGDECW